LTLHMLPMINPIDLKKLTTNKECPRDAWHDRYQTAKAAERFQEIVSYLAHGGGIKFALHPQGEAFSISRDCCRLPETAALNFQLRLGRGDDKSVDRGQRDSIRIRCRRTRARRREHSSHDLYVGSSPFLRGAPPTFYRALCTTVASFLSHVSPNEEWAATCPAPQISL